MNLAQALRVDSAAIAFIGAGGKTTVMFQLARALSGEKGDQPVIVTATSHLGVWQIPFADRHVITDAPSPLEELEDGLRGIILVTGGIDGERTKPIHNDLLDWLHHFCDDHSIPLLIEADGSRGKALKAWAEHEPPVPAFVDLVVQVVGLSGLGKSLTDEHVHRAELYSRWSGLQVGDTITSEALIKVLTHPESGSRNIPATARRTILLNQADTAGLQSVAKALAQSLSAAYDSVIVCSLEQEKFFAVYEPVAAVVLAAGESKRYGQPKQLLDWKGEPFVRIVTKTALQAGLRPVVVVTGAYAEAVEKTVKDLNVTVIRNEEWNSGQATSLKAGIRFLESGSTAPTALRNARTPGGVIFLLADQPQLTGSILRALVERHAAGLYPIVAPMVMDQRANPVLFDQVTFSDLLSLEGDVGGRGIFHKHRVEYLPWHDERLLLDVDTPEMYQRLLSDDTL